MPIFTCREVPMARRHISLLMLAFASFALSACAELTGPQPERDGCADSRAADTCVSAGITAGTGIK